MERYYSGGLSKRAHPVFEGEVSVCASQFLHNLKFQTKMCQNVKKMSKCQQDIDSQKVKQQD